MHGNILKRIKSILILLTMIQDLEQELQPDGQQVHGYTIEPDTAFTTDEIEAIARHKQKLITKLNKNHGVLRGIETSAWGLSSYCLAKFLVYSSGTTGIFPAIAIVLGINQIVNRDLLEFRISRTTEGWELEDMQRLAKFAFSFGFSCFVLWGAIGDYLHVINNSKQTYSDIKEKIAQFQELPQDDKNMTILAGIAGAGLAAWALQGKR
jgi:hypothetical protein